MFYTLLVDSLIKSQDFPRLIHLLRSGVIIDSTEIVRILLVWFGLVLSNAFPP